MGKNLIEQMKKKVAESRSSKKEILYFGKDGVHRVRFLQELDQGYSFEFHSDFNASIYEPCKDPENHEECKCCQDGIKLVENFVWSVWDYDANAVRLLSHKANGVSPIPSLIEMYEEFGTIMDRDYKIKKVGSGQGSSYVITPLDKEKFKNKKAKPYDREEIKEIFDKAYTSKSDEDEDDEEEEDDTPKKKKNKKRAKKEPTLREKFEELDFSELKEIAIEIGMSKKEIKKFDDEEELIDELFDSYEEEDLQDLLDGLDEEEDDDED